MTTLTTTTTKALVVTAAVALLAACGGSGGDGDKSKTGSLKLGITDAPVDHAYAVVVQFSGVELKPMGGEAFSIDFSSPKSIDLLALQGINRTMLLDGATVPMGQYEWVRLKVNADPSNPNDSYVQLTETGQQCEMRIPSGAESGLKINRPFTVGEVADYTIDFDLRKSVVAPPGQTAPSTCDGANQVYMLRPALRMMDNLQVGAIRGTISTPTLQAQCVLPPGQTPPAPYPGNVYLFGPVATSVDIIPDDYDGIENDINGVDAVASAKVSPDTFTYTIAFVPPGNYEVVYTCDLDSLTLDADASAPLEVVDLMPPGGTPVTVTVGVNSEVNF